MELIFGHVRRQTDIQMDGQTDVEVKIDIYMEQNTIFSSQD